MIQHICVLAVVYFVHFYLADHVEYITEILALERHLLISKGPTDLTVHLLKEVAPCGLFASLWYCSIMEDF